MSPDATALEGAQADRAAVIISTLADEAGARRPTSRSERIAAEVVGEALRVAGLDVRREPFAASTRAPSRGRSRSAAR